MSVKSEFVPALNKQYLELPIGVVIIGEDRFLSNSYLAESEERNNNIKKNQNQSKEVICKVDFIQAQLALFKIPFKEN